MFMGDAVTEAENRFFLSGGNLDADALKVGQHSSSSGSSLTFLNAVKPIASIIGVGAGSDYSHPTSKILKSLKSTGSAICRTDIEGNIVVTTDGEGITENSGQSRCSGSAPISISSTATSSQPATAAVTSSSDGPFVGSFNPAAQHQSGPR